MLSAVLPWPFSSQRTDMPPKDNRRRASSVEGRLAETLRGSAAAVKDPAVEAEMKTAAGLSRMVDMRIPLWGILSGMGALALVLVNMWFSVQQLTAAMADVQLTLKAGNAQANGNAIEIATIKLRLENAERTYRDLQQQVTQQQYQQRPPR